MSLIDRPSQFNATEIDLKIQNLKREFQHLGFSPLFTKISSTLSQFFMLNIFFSDYFSHDYYYSLLSKILDFIFHWKSQISFPSFSN